MRVRRRVLNVGVAASIGMLGGALSVLGGSVIDSATPAGAVNNNPAGNPTSPAVSYEADCTSSLEGGAVAPFVSSTVIDTSTDTATPTGATFGVSGTVSQTIVGSFLAAFNAGYAAELGSEPATLGLTPTETFGSTDGHATGTYTYTNAFTPVTNPGTVVKAAGVTEGSTTVTGDFSGATVGDAIADSGPSGGSALIPSGATITAINGTTSATISEAATGTDASDTTAYAPFAGVTYTDSDLSSGDVFTTAGTSGETAGIGITSVTSQVITGGIIPITFGGSTGQGAANCLETGWVNATTPGPGQGGGATPPLETQPVLPNGTTTALVSATPTFQSGAYVNLQTSVSYEADCTSSLEGGAVAPFISSTFIDATTDEAAPTGATFGVTGTVSQTIVGSFLAAFNAGYAAELGSEPTTLGLTPTETFGSTDGHATGTYTYTNAFTPVTNPGTVVKAAGVTEGSTTVTGDFSGATVGDAIADNDGYIPSGATVTAVNGTTSATISEAATGTDASDVTGYAPFTGVTYTDSDLSSGDVFTTAGTSGETAGIGITSVTSQVITGGIIPITFGGSTGQGPANCLETGWVNSTTPGPGQGGGATPPLETQPVLPYGTTTDLVSTTPTFQPGASVSLVTPLSITAPTSFPQASTGYNMSVAMDATGGTAPYTWSASGQPAGVVVSSNILHGVPTVAGTYSVTLTVTDAAGHSASETLPLTVVQSPPPLTITNAVPGEQITPLPPGTPGKAYDETLTATGGVPPYSWAVSQGELPPGLKLNSSTGVISGVPGAPDGAESTSFVITVTDSASPPYPTTATNEFSITVYSGKTTTTVSASTTTPVSGQPVTYTATVSPASEADGKPQGVVSFKSGSTIIGSARLNGSSPDEATLTSATKAVGSHTITATYKGTIRFGSSSGTADIDVTQAPTSTSLSASPTTATKGQDVTFTATVSVNSPGAGSPAGVVTFTQGSTIIGSASLNGSSPDEATLTRSFAGTGSHTITATYKGTSTYGSSSGNTTVVVTKA